MVLIYKKMDETWFKLKCVKNAIFLEIMVKSFSFVICLNLNGLFFVIYSKRETSIYSKQSAYTVRLGI